MIACISAGWYSIKLSHRIVPESKQFEVIDGALYHENLTFGVWWCPRSFM